MIIIKKNYNAVDLVKFIFAIIVIVVHTYPFYESNPTVGFVTSNILGRLVIPFYFISAGYFLEKGKSSKDESYFKKYMKRLVTLYLLWSLVSLPAGLHLLSDLIDVNVTVALGGLVVGILYAGTYYHLWYMAALIFSMYASHFLLRKIKLKTLLIISFGLYIFGLFETYYALTDFVGLSTIVDTYFAIFITTRNGIFFGLLFVTLGIAIGRHDLNLKLKRPLMWTIILFIVLLFEAFIVRDFNLAKDYNMYLTNLPLMFCFFSWLLQLKLNWNINFKTLREYSTIIYFSHGMFLEYIPMMLGASYGYLYDIGIFRFISVFSLTMILSWIIRKFIPRLY